MQYSRCGKLSEARVTIGRVNPYPVVDPDELKEAAQIRWLLSLLERFHDLYTRLDYKSPTQKSQLAADDRATGWLQTSHQVRSYLNMAADNVRALLAMLIVDEKLQIPLHAHYPVIRAALEGAAQAKWVLLPDDHAERVRRSLAARVTDEHQDRKLFDEQCAAILLYDPTAVDQIALGKEQEARKAAAAMIEIQRCAHSASIDKGTVLSGAPGMVTILRRVAVAGDVPGEYASSVWKVLSGLSQAPVAPSVTPTLKNSANLLTGSSPRA